jgi:hypothetical protein
MYRFDTGTGMFQEKKISLASCRTTQCYWITCHRITSCFLITFWGFVGAMLYLITL